MASDSSGLIETQIRCCRNFGQPQSFCLVWRRGVGSGCPWPSPGMETSFNRSQGMRMHGRQVKVDLHKGTASCNFRKLFTLGKFKVKQDQLQLNEWLKVNMFRKVRFL
jgi:hypothetical protein